MKVKDNNKNKYFSLGNILANIIYYLVLIPLVIIALAIVYQQISQPDKIPNVFGYKMFIILDGSMDESVENGDLVFTKNIDANELNIGELIAFRNDMNTITIHKIIDISEKYQIDEQTKEEKEVITFTMKALENETNDTKYVKDSKVEGIVKNKIPYIRNDNYIYATAISNFCYNLYYFINWICMFIYCK